MLNFTSFVKFTKLLLLYCCIMWYMLFLVKSNFVNICENFEDYYNVYSTSNCSYIYDNYEEAPEIIRRHAGVSETHQVTTEDGYVLTLFRIPQKNPKEVILFLHGYGIDSTYWVSQYNESVALYFWKAGYDIWLLNNRGTEYSKKHVKLSPKEEQFWKFSFHEVGYYDLSASIDYVKNVTKVDKIIFVGYSLGASAGSVYSSLRPEEAESSLKIIIELAPMAYGRYSPSSVVKYILPIFADHITISKFHRMVNKHSHFEHDSWYLKLWRFLNSYFPFKMLSAYFVSAFLGWTPDEVDPRFINLMVDKIGSSTSWQMWQHCAQINKQQNKFLLYDYGIEENLKLYGNESPPLYPLENIKVPIFLVYSRDDWISVYEDSKYLYEMLPDRAKIYGRLEIEGLNHLDFYFGKHRIQKVYEEVLKLLQNITSLSH